MEDQLEIGGFTSASRITERAKQVEHAAEEQVGACPRAPLLLFQFIRFFRFMIFMWCLVGFAWRKQVGRAADSAKRAAVTLGRRFTGGGDGSGEGPGAFRK